MSNDPSAARWNRELVRKALLMLPALRRWREQRNRQAQERLIEDTFDVGFGRPSQRHIKKWKDRELHAWLVSGELHPVERSMAERELKKREAWDAPAGRAYWIAIAALLVSTAALVKSFFFA